LSISHKLLILLLTSSNQFEIFNVLIHTDFFILSIIVLSNQSNFFIYSLYHLSSKKIPHSNQYSESFVLRVFNSFQLLSKLNSFNKIFFSHSLIISVATGSTIATVATGFTVATGSCVAVFLNVFNTFHKDELLSIFNPLAKTFSSFIVIANILDINFLYFSCISLASALSIFQSFVKDSSIFFKKFLFS
jgi:hypothetical protein